MGVPDLIETESPSITEGRNRPRKGRRLAVRFAIVLGVILIGTMVMGALFLNSLSNKYDVPSGQILEKATWRMRLFALKARGGIPELSWSELRQMIFHRGGFGLEGTLNGYSFDGGVRNEYDTDADLQAASTFFSERCAMCHGKDGAEGKYGAPALNHTGFRHGDSDLAIYKVLRDGVPNTAMQPPPMTLAQRWQLVGYIRHLQLQNTGLASLGDSKAALNIEVSSESVLSAGSKTDEWLTYSGSLDGHRYTPLNQITPANASKLKIRWVRQFDSTLPSSEATPIVVGGVIFTTEPPGETIAVDAINAKSGELIWKYTRNVPTTEHACCGRNNKGLAVLGNHVFLASLEGYLVCLNADNGSVVWETQVADPSQWYWLNLAPLIVNQSVIVGVAGGELGIRGFLASYDSETGKKQWQFDTIPGPGEPGHETWTGDSWRTGGGSTWVTGSYDPLLGLIYWGVGNPSPDFLGDARPGDNLYTDSVIALHADTGKLAWHFQFTPHDVHDRDSTQTPILADLLINGKNRKVICWANRNGFYYVLDRVTGEFLTGAPFVVQTWAKGLDSTGRPILDDSDDVSNAGRIVRPGISGGTNFQNPAFDQQRGLVFVPATESASVFTKSLHAARGERGYFGASAATDTNIQTTVVRALDAATGTKKWEYFSRPTDNPFYYSGLLATGGGLVFGCSGGSLFALDSTTGREVWRVFLGGDTRAAPISFMVDGKQVIAVSAGRSLFVFGL
jgi:alcohol dehydrogenase (cytochrome c)